MRTIHVIIGKSLSGKSWVQKKCNLPKLVTCTTRPMRKKEVNGYDYHFVSEYQYNADLSRGSVVAGRCYSTVDGNWNYYIGKSSLEGLNNGHFGNNVVIVLDLKGYHELRKYVKDNYSSISVKGYYLNCPLEVRLKRIFSSERSGEDLREVVRRIYNDEINDFNGLDDDTANFLSDITVYNDSSNLVSALNDFCCNSATRKGYL